MDTDGKIIYIFICSKRNNNINVVALYLCSATVQNDRGAGQQSVRWY